MAQQTTVIQCILSQLKELAAQGRASPGYVEQEVEDYLKCGRLEQSFLRVGCDTCHAEHLIAFSCYSQRKTICSSRSGCDESGRE